MHSEFLAYSQDDRDKAIWQYVREQRTCTCGTRPEEWDPEQGGHRHAYFPQITTCPGCVGIERTQQAPEMQGDQARGKRISLARNPDLE